MEKKSILDALSFPQLGAKQWWEGTRVQRDGVTEGTYTDAAHMAPFFFFFFFTFKSLFIICLNFILFNFIILCWFCHISK